MQESNNSFIKIILTINNLTIADLAFILEVSPSYISAINKGSRKLNLKIIDKIAKNFNYKMYDLLKVYEYMEIENDYRKLLLFALNTLCPELHEHYSDEESKENRIKCKK